MTPRIRALAVGGGGGSCGTHATDDGYSSEGGAAGVERALLIILEAAGVA